jgi:hypothetical protein
MKMLLALIGFGVGFVLLMIGILWLMRKKKEHAYEEDYIFVSSCVKYWAVCPQTYHRIIAMLTKLSLNEACDPERNKQLWEEFRLKFTEYDLGLKLEEKDVLINQN